VPYILDVKPSIQQQDMVNSYREASRISSGMSSSAGGRLEPSGGRSCGHTLRVDESLALARLAGFLSVSVGRVEERLDTRVLLIGIVGGAKRENAVNSGGFWGSAIVGTGVYRHGGRRHCCLEVYKGRSVATSV
jgi:hypothetical protein